jgi:dethiobiotin synthetase
VAARIEARPFDVTSVINAYDHIARRSPRLLLVEGAGGLLVPFGDELLGADLAVELRLPLLVVARASLGTINHTLLTVNEARRRGLSVAAVILNRVAPEVGPDEATNASEIERLARVRVLGPVPHLAAPLRRDPVALADAVETAFDPGILLT